MILNRNTNTRRGAVLPMVALSLVGLIGLLALSIDIGMIAIARSQCQNAADAGAIAGIRTFNGNVSGSYNLPSMPVKAIGAAISNQVLSKAVQGDPAKVTNPNAYTYKSGQVSIEAGAYTYIYNDSNPSQEGFKIQFPKQTAGEPYTAVRSTVEYQGNLFFGRVFGATTTNTSATAVAVHRPRDVMIIMDLSGSMRFQSLPGMYVSGSTAYPSSSSRPRTHSMNPENVYPKFGHYSDTATAKLRGTTAYSTGDEMCDPANISVTTNGGPPIAEYFFQNAFGVAPGPGNRAFTRAADTQETTPGGDNYLNKNNHAPGQPYAKTVNEILNAGAGKDLKWERNGYQEYVANFNGYTEGPGYWGKTFFLWPPDPRGPQPAKNPATAADHADNGSKDWRQRFFFKVNTSSGTLGWLDHTNILFDPSGTPATASNFGPTNSVIRDPETSVSVSEGGSSVSYRYRINYAAILHWLRNQNPKPFPTQLRSGRIKFYDAIPDPSDTALNNRWWTTQTLANLNERFWREYIDFVLGLQVTGTSSGFVTYTTRNTDPDGNSLSSVPFSALIGNGDYYAWGTTKVSAKPDSTPYTTSNVNLGAGYGLGVLDIVTTKAGSTPSAGHFVKFGNHNTIYKIQGAPTKTAIKLDIGLTTAVANNESIKYWSALPKSMDYDDNPLRAKHQLWFGPMTFIDFLGNYNTRRFWWPGTVPEAQAWAAKVGIQTAIEDIKNNHPSDFIGLCFFSNPRNSNTDNTGFFNRAVVPVGRDYQKLKDSLWFPPSTVVGSAVEITPYDDDFDQVPRAQGGTSPGMGFMLAYNALSSSVNNLRTYSTPQPQHRGAAGGLGRKGATRLVVFETDGAPNTRSYAAMGGSGTDSYYKVRLKVPDSLKNASNLEFPSSGSYADSEVYGIVDQICKQETASPPGFATPRRKVLVHAIGYGTLFDPANPSAGQNDALAFMHQVATKGNTAVGSTLPDDRRIYGTPTQRVDRIREAFTEIMQQGVQVSLIEQIVNVVEMQMSDRPAAVFDQVVKEYPQKRSAALRAIDNVSLRIEPGEVFGLIGPNRAGKTTLVKLLLSLCRPTHGRVQRLGHDSSDCATLARIGYVHENPAFPKYLSATALLEFYGALSLLEEKQVTERVPRLLSDVGLADRAHEPISRFSKGMLQRLGLAQALLTQPELLVLDEPSEGLDLVGRQLLRRIITEQRHRGAVFYVTHLLGEVEQLCDRVGVLVGGRLAYLGTVTGLTKSNGTQRTLEDAVKDFYQSPSLN